MRVFLFIVFLTCSASAVMAANPPDLNALAAKAAAKVQGLIPNAKSEVQGTTAVIKKNTVMAPDFEFKGSKLMTKNGGKSTEKPSDKGVMMIIQFSKLPYSGPALPQFPEFNSQRAQHLVGYFRTGALQRFPAKNVAMAVQILYGPYSDLPPVVHAYVELTGFVAGELAH